MEKKEKSLKTFVIVFISFLLFMTLASVLLRLYNEREYPEKFSDEVTVEENYERSFPQIVNMPPRSISFGESFNFTPRFSPEGDSFKIALLRSPEWLEWDGTSVNGVPQEIGEFEFVLRLEVDGRYVDEEFFLIVMDGENE